MNVTYCKGTPEDEQAIVDFADLVFSKSHRPHDFRRQLPNLYGEGKRTQQYHYLVKEDGVIRGMVCVVPMEYRVGGEVLKVNGVGSVSVHSSCKGKGYMKALMNWALKDMEKEGVAFSALSGQRQRYEYFGYAPAGPVWEYTVEWDNIRHRYGKADASMVTFEKAEKDAPWLQKAWELHQGQTARIERKQEEFFDLLRSWHGEAYGIFFSGEWIGYLCLVGNTVLEMLFQPRPGEERQEEKRMPQVLKALMEKMGLPELHIALPLWEGRLSPELGRLSGEMTIVSSGNFRVMDFEKTAGAFLQMKQASPEGPLPEGELLFAIEGRGILRLQVKDGAASARMVPEKEAGEPLFRLTALEASRLLFAPGGWRELSPEQVKKLSPAVKSWLPLPLFLWKQDEC